MSKVLDASVHKNGDQYDFRCPGVQGSPCGDLGSGIPFISTSWPTRVSALARGRQHLDEHKGLGPMQPLHEFRRDQGLVVVDGGSAVSAKDL